MNSTMKYLNQWKDFYFTFLPYALSPPLFSSTYNSFKIMDDKILSPTHKLFDIMGIYSVGTFSGIFYPVTMPLFAIRYLYRNRIV